MAMNGCSAEKKDEVNGENIPCFNYLYFNSLPQRQRTTANLMPVNAGECGEIISLICERFLSVMKCHRTCAMPIQNVSYCCEQNANINTSLLPNIWPKRIHKASVIFVFEIMGKRCSKI